LGYLKGTIPDAHNIIVEDIIVAKQEVTAGSVDVLEPPMKEGIVGSVHQHPGGGGQGFLSSIDRDDVGGNYDVVISVNASGNYCAESKKKLPCGASILVEAKVVVIYPYEKEAEDFVAASMPNILEVKYVQPKQPNLPIIYPGVYSEIEDNLGKVTNDKGQFYCIGCQSSQPKNGSRVVSGFRVCQKCYHNDVP
jgi:hypothetical protein